MCTGCCSGPVIVGSESLVWMVPEPASCELPCDADVPVELEPWQLSLEKEDFDYILRKMGI